MDHAILVEKDRAAQQVILENIKMTKEPEKFQLLKMSAERVLSNLSETFDLVLLDPPYAKEQIVENLELLKWLQLPNYLSLQINQEHVPLQNKGQSY